MKTALDYSPTEAQEHFFYWPVFPLYSLLANSSVETSVADCTQEKRKASNLKKKKHSNIHEFQRSSKYLAEKLWNN